MKKLISIVISVSLMFCVVGCSEGNDAIKGSLFTSEEKETQKPASTSSKNDINSANSSSDEVLINDMPEWSGKVFKYYNTTCDSLDLFVDWIKADGKLEIDGVRYDQWEYGDAFLETVSKEKEILLPIAKNGSEFFNVRISANSSWYCVIYNNKLDSGETVSLDIGLVLGIKNNEYGSVFEWAQNQPVNEGVELHKSKHSVYGDYCYKNYAKDASGNRKNITSAYIEVNGAYVVIDVWGDVHEKPWNPEYLDYFDFEKVTLK